MKRILFVFILLTLSTALTLAEQDHEDEIEKGRLIVEAKTSCDSLSDEELEAVGEYYMELMHPGALHDAMHEMMGLQEGTEEHDEFHIDLARRMYCGDGTYGMMGGRFNGGMGYGMMTMMFGSGAYSPWNFWNFAYIVLVAIIFAVIFWIIYLLVKKEKRK